MDLLWEREAVTTFITAVFVDRVYEHRFTEDRLRKIQSILISTRC